jgi:hypothetical protein
MINIIPYNLFEMSKIKLQDYYPHLKKIEDIVRARDHEKYADFPERWYVSVNYDLTYFSNFVDTNKDIKKFRSVQLFQIEIFFDEKFKGSYSNEKKVHNYYIRFDEDSIIIRRSLHSFVKTTDERQLPIETLKDPNRFFKRVIEEIKEMEEDV